MIKEEIWKEEEKLTKYIIAKVKAKATGSDEDECIKNLPRDVYFLGNLSPKNVDSNIGGHKTNPILQELSSKLSPVAFGGEFLLKTGSEAKSSKVEIEVSWAVYYRTLPDFQQQKKFQLQGSEANKEDEKNESIESKSEDFEATDDGEDNNNSSEGISLQSKKMQSNIQRDSMLKVFKKIKCRAKGTVEISRLNNEELKVDDSNLLDQLNRECLRAQEIVLGDNLRFKTSREVEENVRISSDILESEAKYFKYLSTLRTDVVPEWKWEVYSKVTAFGVGSVSRNTKISFQFANSSKVARNSSNKEGYFFDAEAIFAFTGYEVIPFELEYAPRDFRYDRYMWGRGFNCGIENLKVDEPTVSIFKTTNMPYFEQKKMESSQPLVLTFEQLAKEPVSSLEMLLTSMKNYFSKWESSLKSYQNGNPNWNREFDSIYGADFAKFKTEVERFEKGLDLIKADEDIKLGFMLTNETFRRTGEKSQPKKNAWRTFQIVFLVSQLPDVFELANKSAAENKNRETVDIIYYPTGGGKTETYLAVVVFQCFYDRLRGKTAGVSAWTRFPLRLLTKQQMQRFADIIGIAELVRLQQNDLRLCGPDVDGFAVGYFVGKDSTPNEIFDPAAKNGRFVQGMFEWSQANDQTERQKWKEIYRCPSCQSYTVEVTFDKEKRLLSHRCTNPSCLFKEGRIPVYIVDNDIYRYLPTVVVGTIDKLAGLGNQRKMALILGQVDGKCSKHGYYKIKCCQKDCDNKNLVVGKPKGLTAPSLFVQDELHLLKEGLGTFDAHYETFLQQLYREFDQERPLKIIASTATIESFERQVKHLYGRIRSNIFPGPGPELKSSFYTETFDFPQRYYVGIIPHNKTLFNAILELIKIYHEILNELKVIKLGAPNPYKGSVKPGTKEWSKLLKSYSTSLVYFNSMRYLSGIHHDLEFATNPLLEDEGYRALSISELTGHVSSVALSNTLEKLETQQPESKGFIDTILATSTVSHGVDVEGLNAMIFYGMPRQTGEYIQSSSRVGRIHTGIVFNCLDPVRERDQSNYLYFIKQHEYMGRMVEPVAIDRWSKFSIQRTIPGLFMGVLLQLISNSKHTQNPNNFYLLKYVKNLIINGELTKEQFVPILEHSYLLNDQEKQIPSYFKNEIEKSVDRFFDAIIESTNLDTFVSEALIPAPMRSLRDVDEPIVITLDERGSRWGSNRKGDLNE